MTTRERSSRREGGAWLADDRAVACLVLWRCGLFDTSDIAELLGCREDAVCRTLHMARDGSRQDARAGA